jgi:hypothetical protein
VRTASLTSSKSLPHPEKIQCVVPEHGSLFEPFPVQRVTSELASAALGNMAHTIMRRVATVTASRPAVGSRLTFLFE